MVAAHSVFGKRPGKMSDSPKHRALSSGYAPFGITAAWAVFAWLFHDAVYDEVAILASTGLLFGAVWFLRWEPTRDWDPLRLIGFAAFAQAFIGSGLSVIRTVETAQLRFTPAPGSFSSAVASAFLFTSMFVLGVFATMLVLRQKTLSNDDDAQLPDWLAWTLAGLASAYGLATAFGWPIATKFGNAPTIVFKLSLVLTLLTATQLVQKRSMKLPLALIFGAQLVGMLTTSMLANILLPVRDVILTFFHLGKRFPWRLAVAVGIFLLVLNPAKHAVRSELSRDRGSLHEGFEGTERAAGAWRQALEQTWFSDSQTSVSAERHLRTTLSRLDYNWATALIFTLVPTMLPFEQGRTYEDIPTVLIPRILYPDKPGSADYFRTRWTVRLGIQTWESAKQTAIAIPAFGEAYWNFGWLGVALIPAVIGLLVGVLVYLAPSHAVGRTAYMVVIATSLTSFLDMLIWHIPQFVTVLVTAGLVRLYVRRAPRGMPTRRPNSALVALRRG